MDYPILEATRLILKELCLEDEKNIEQHYSDPAVSQFVEIGNNETAADIIRFHLGDSGCRWGIITKTDKEFIGTCGFYCWDIESGTSEIDYDLSMKYWGKGYMKEALESIIEFVFFSNETESYTGGN